jgi:hypothetical protein
MHQYSPTGCKEYWVPNELIGMLGTCQTWYPVGQGTPSQNWYPIRNWYQAKQGVEPTNEFIGNSAVADLGRSMGVIAPAFEENFSIFPSKNERKMSSYYLKWASKIGFCLKSPLLSKKSPLPSKILDPPLTLSSLCTQSPSYNWNWMHPYYEIIFHSILTSNLTTR